jgi:ribonuclease P protein component
MYGLKKPAEFKAVYNNCLRKTSNNLLFLYVKNNIGYSRLGIVVSKKTCKRAVDRNAVKRIVKECFASLILKKIIRNNCDIVVIAKRNILELDKKSRYHVIYKQMEDVLACV